MCVLLYARKNFGHIMIYPPAFVRPSKHFGFRGYITVKRTIGSFRDQRVYGLVALKKTKKITKKIAPKPKMLERPSVRLSVRPLAIWFPEHNLSFIWPQYSNFIGGLLFEGGNTL
jgi:hypothetical protein